jgi:hypothetical protein
VLPINLRLLMLFFFFSPSNWLYILFFLSRFTFVYQINVKVFHSLMLHHVEFFFFWNQLYGMSADKKSRYLEEKGRQKF